MALSEYQINFLAKMISIKSVHSDKDINAPYGKNSRLALDTFLAEAERLGFSTGVSHDKVGWVEFGEGKDILGCVCHLDVVPADDEEFELKQIDNSFFGRGIIDDKGPACAAFFAMQELKNEGFTPNKRIRLILGTDEEVSCDCVETYSKYEEIPSFAITPDAEFPVVFAEKGILQIRIYSNHNSSGLLVKGGSAPNAVPASAVAVFEGKTIEALGKTAHASKPQLGINAISLLPSVLTKAGVDYSKSSLLNFINDYCKQADCEKLTNCNTCDESGRITFNPGMIDIDKANASLVIDIRYPVTASYDSICEAIKKAVAKYDLSMNVCNHMPPICKAKDSEEIRILTDIWKKHMSAFDGFEEQYTSQYTEPVAIGGGTYARHIPNTIAFGMQAPWQEDQCHQKGEHIAVSDFEQYIRVLKEVFEKLS